jgi:hypothetical protein
VSGAFALLGLTARSLRVSENAASPTVPVDIARKSHASSWSASWKASSPGDGLTEFETFSRSWEADRMQTRDRLHERLC